MTNKPLNEETIALLLKETNPVVRASVSSKCGSCGTKLDNGYCRNNECLIDRTIPHYNCDFCGNCPNPNKCVVSVICVHCFANPGEQCRGLNGAVASYHEERWQTVKLSYGVYYK